MKQLLCGLLLCIALTGIARAQSSIEPWLELSADGHFDDYLPGGGEGFVARFAPGAGLRVHTPRLSLRLEGSAAYDRYEGGRTTLPDSWNGLALLRTSWRATHRLTLDANDAFADA